MTLLACEDVVAGYSAADEVLKGILKPDATEKEEED